MIRLFSLYIDPGTGSALFSILIGAAATLYFVSRAVIIKLKVSLFAGKAAQISMQGHPYVIYCEGKQYWNVFKPVLDEFEKRRQELVYLTSAEDDPVFGTGYQMVKPEYIGEGNKAYARLNLLAADFVLMTTPGLNVYQLKRSKAVRHYSHLLHAPSDATMYRLFGIDYFDSVLLTGDYQANDIQILEKQRNIKHKELVTVGCPYLDVYAEKMKALRTANDKNEAPSPAGGFTVLVSPSWGQSALLTKYGERLLKPLVQTGWNIIVRPHPQSKTTEKEMLKRLTEKYKEHQNLVWDYERDNILSLSRADVMISDFSGIIFDYTFLCDKPVFYVSQGMDLRPYDADDICSNENNGKDLKKLWQFRALEEFGIELTEEMFDSIGNVIRNASDSPDLQAARQKAKDEAWMYRGEAGKKTADFMIKTVSGY
jgi:hypothetical protein